MTLPSCISPLQPYNLGCGSVSSEFSQNFACTTEDCIKSVMFRDGGGKRCIGDGGEKRGVDNGGE